MKEVKVGLIGANWMGSFHSVGLTNVRQAYHDVKPVFEHVADVNEAAAQLAADRFGYKKSIHRLACCSQRPGGGAGHYRNP